MRFSVIIKGIAPGKSPQEVAERIASLFKTDARKVSSAMMALPMTVKNNLTADAAERYRVALENAGVIVELKNEQAEEKKKAPPTPAPAPPRLSKPITPGRRWDAEMDAERVKAINSAVFRLLPLFSVLSLALALVAVYYIFTNFVDKPSTAEHAPAPVEKKIAQEKTPDTQEPSAPPVQETPKVEKLPAPTAPTQSPAPSSPDMKLEEEVNIAALPHVPVIPIALAAQTPISPEDFKSRFPLPVWWDTVSAPEFNAIPDLMDYWRDRQRTKSQFFKAAFGMLARYPDKPAYVMKIVYLLPSADPSYEKMLELEEYALGAFFSHKDTDGQRPATSSAGIATDLMWRYNNTSEFEKAVGLGKRLFGEREKEINDHMLEFAVIPLAEAYAGAGDVRTAVETLDRAITKYNGSWEKKLWETRERIIRKM